MGKTEELRRRPLLGVLLLMVNLLVGVSLVSSPPWPSLRLSALPENACGLAGKVTAQTLWGGLGVPVVLWGGVVGFALAMRALFLRPRRPWLFLAWSGATGLLLSLLGGVTGGQPPWGDLSLAVADFLSGPGALGPIGAALVTGGLLAVFVVGGVPWFLPVRARGAAMRAAQGAGRTMAGGISALLGRPGASGSAAGAPDRDSCRTPTGPVAAVVPPRPAEKVPAHDDERKPPRDAVPGPRPRVSVAPRDSDLDPSVVPGRGRGKKPKDEAKGRGVRPAAPAAAGPWVLPPVWLLESGEPPIVASGEDLQESGQVIVRTLQEFGILGRLGAVHPGPVVTQYEYEPAAGVRVSQVVSRKDDLALALRASRIRLVAPIPGKAAIGIEVPNRIASTISLRAILEEIDPSALPGVLPLVLGRDTRGRAYAARLEQMPHLLVAGTTGSGKSVFLNGVLLSLLLRRTPDELRLLLIDPKMLELTPYDGIPHLICPVVTEAKQAARMLVWAVGEMERRYRHMAALGVRNLDGYREKERVAGPDGGVTPMPHLVILVDELADLMLTLQNEIEGPVMRLAQMARAVGIHLVLATQRPSVDVITGVIKANFPARVAFQVASKVDSRTILDANGAEDLLGRGDMLFLPPGKAEAVRVHGAYAGERDAVAVADFLRAQPPAPPLFRDADLAREEGDTEIEDELFQDALRLVVQHRQASVSFLQRRLKVGYSRAGRLMDILEHAGAVGPQDGSKTREVLADEIFLERICARDEQDASRSRS
jgi:S-DNA-T family DNA segregation ATPase FtsK/SpoIIIE